jgi:hypothetical protein
VGTLVTLDLPDDSPVLSLPWIITFGPAEDDEAWEPVVCGPYERAHALALAETVIADNEELMAVVEPLQPHTSVEAIHEEIANARLAGSPDDDEDDEEFDFDDDEGDDVEVSMDGEFDEHAGHDHDDDDMELEEVEPTAPPSPAEVRAGFARIAARLTVG